VGSDDPGRGSLPIPGARHIRFSEADPAAQGGRRTSEHSQGNAGRKFVRAIP